MLPKRDIAWSIDTLVPGAYAWLGDWTFAIGGGPAEPSYPGIIHAFAGVAIVLPGGLVLTTYQGGFDPAGN